MFSAPPGWHQPLKKGYIREGGSFFSFPHTPVAAKAKPSTPPTRAWELSPPLSSLPGTHRLPWEQQQLHNLALPLVPVLHRQAATHRSAFGLMHAPHTLCPSCIPRKKAELVHFRGEQGKRGEDPSVGSTRKECFIPCTSQSPQCNAHLPASCLLSCPGVSLPRESSGPS